MKLNSLKTLAIFQAFFTFFAWDLNLIQQNSNKIIISNAINRLDSEIKIFFPAYFHYINNIIYKQFQLLKSQT